MDAHTLLRLAEMLVRLGSLGRLGSKTVLAEVRKVIEGVQSVDDARAVAIAEAKRDALERMGIWLAGRVPSSGAAPTGGEARVLSSGVAQAAVVREQPYRAGDAEGVRVVVEGRVGARALDARLRALLADPRQLERLRASEQRNDALLAENERLETRNRRVGERRRPAEEHALRRAFAENTRKLEAQHWYEQGQALWDGSAYSDPERAQALFSEAIRLVPDYPLYYFQRGNANYFWKQYSLALRDFDTAADLDPRYPEVYNNRGNAHSARKAYREAVADYDRAVHLGERDGDYRNNRGNAFYHLGDARRALAEYDEAIRLAPGRAVYYNNRGNAWDAVRERDKALADYSEAIRLDGRFALAHYNRGFTYEVLAQHRQAMDDYGRAIRIEPRHADAYFRRGCIHDSQGRWRAARREYRKAARLGHREAAERVRRLERR